MSVKVYLLLMFIYMFFCAYFYVLDFNVYVLFMFCYAETLFRVWRLVVSPGPLKPSVSDGIESRGHYASPLCFIHFLSSSFSHMCTFVGVYDNNDNNIT